MPKGANLFDAEVSASRTSGYSTVVNTIYRIVSRSTLDFTTVGSSDNTAGTVFVANAVGALGSGDELQEITSRNRGIPAVDPWPALADSELFDADDQNDIDTADWNAANATVNSSTQCTLDATTGYVHYKDITVEAGQLYRWEQTATYGTATNPKTAIYDITNSDWIEVGGVDVYDYALNDGTPTIIYFMTPTTPSPCTTLRTYAVRRSDTIGTVTVGGFSLRKVDVSWVPNGANTIEIDESEDALKIGYVDDANGAIVYLRDAHDLSSDLVVGQKYIFSAQAKYAGGAVQLQIYDGSSAQNINLTDNFHTHTQAFTAQHATNAYIRLNGMGATEEAFIRNLSVYADYGENPVLFTAPASGVLPGPNRVRLIQWVDANADAADNANLIMEINGVTVEATVQRGVAPDGQAVLWQKRFDKPMVIKNFNITTMTAGNVHLWLA